MGKCVGEHVMLQNTSELDSMFEIVKDYTPITEEEKKRAKEIDIIYKRLMK